VQDWSGSPEWEPPLFHKNNFAGQGGIFSGLGHNKFKLYTWGTSPVGSTMPRLYFFLRLLAIAVAFPAILLYMLVATALHPVAAIYGRLRTPLRVWMGVLDWARGIPVGYSYWEQYEAPSMLDEIVVHHDD
jgi:hypothetical protein